MGTRASTRTPSGVTTYPRVLALGLALLLVSAAMAVQPTGALADDGPNPHFNVEVAWDSLWGHEWPEGATLTVEIDGTVVADDVIVHDDHWDHGGPGDFHVHLTDWDIQPGQHVTVTSDDPPVSKSHTVTALTITDIDEAADTVSGTTDADPGSTVEVHIMHQGWPIRYAEVAADGTWTADFSQPDDDGEDWGGTADIGPGTHGSAWDRDDDGDATAAHWHVVNPHFNVDAGHDSLWGHDWPEGATLTVDVDGTIVADDIEVYTDWEEHGGPGDFAFHDSGFDFQAGQTVTVSSDDPPASKSHTITALTVTDIDEAADTVSGTTDSDAGSEVEVHLHWHDDWRMRHVEVAADGTWTADFSVSVDDDGEGWGDPADIAAGTHGSAWERDDEGDSTVAHWHVVNPHFNVNPWHNSVWGHEWSPGATLTIEADGTVVAEDVEVEEWGDFDLWDLEHDFEAGQTVTVTSDDDPPHVKTHVITALEVTEVDVEANTVAGTTDSDPGSIVEVYVHGHHAVRYVEVGADGSWEADFSEPADDDGEGWGEPFDIVPGMGGDANERDEDFDGTFAPWQVDNPHFNINRDTGWLWGGHWTPGAEVTITVNGAPATTDPEVVTVIDQDSPWYSAGDIHVEILEPEIEVGDEITVSDGVDARTHIVTSVTITSVDAATDIVTGTAEPGSEGLVVVEHWESGRNFVADGDGEWVADFSQPVDEDHGQPDEWFAPYDIVPGMWVEAMQTDEQGSSTVVDSMAGFAVDDVLMTQPDVAATIDVLANDHMPEGDDELQVIDHDATSVEGGTVDCEPAGECTYTPPAGFVGDDAFTYEVESSPRGLTDTATVHVSVRPTEASFTDVPTEHTFFTEIEWLALSGITTGYTDGTFRPTAPVTRQATAAFFYRYAGEPEFTPPSTPSFTDVPTTHDFFTEIEWLASTGITTGYDDGTFRPTATVTRQATAAFFHRYAGAPEFAAPTTASFTDVPTDHTFFTEIEWLADTGVTTGYDDGTFRPTATVTRQATAAFFYRYDRLP